MTNEEAIKLIDDRMCYGRGKWSKHHQPEIDEYWQAGEMAIKALVQPEIIRCKDCKHWIPYDWMFSEMWQSKNIADYPEDDMGCDCCEMAMKANDFCSRAVRREVTT